MSVTSNTWYSGWPIRTGSKGDVIDEWKATRIARKANHLLADKVYVISSGSYSRIDPEAGTSNSVTSAGPGVSLSTDTEDTLFYGYALVPYPSNKITLKIWAEKDSGSGSGTIKLYVGDRERIRGYDKYFTSNSATVTADFWVTPSLGAPPDNTAGFHTITITRPFIPPNRVVFFRATKTNLDRVGQWVMYAEYTDA